MIYVAAGWGFVLLLVLISYFQDVSSVPFVVGLLLLLLLIGLRVFLHVRHEDHAEHLLDVILSFLFILPGLSLFITILQDALVFFGRDVFVFDPVAIGYFAIGAVLVLPFVVLSFWSLFVSLRRLHADRS